MKIREVLKHLEQKFPLCYQEDFDNCGVQCGDVNREITGVLVCFEMSDETIDEALACGANLVLSHHPLMLKRGICKIEPTGRVGRILCKALENKMVLYSMHTNIDSAAGGGNDVFAEKLHLQNIRVLEPQSANLQKITFFVPSSHSQRVQDALFQLGCGKSGNYDRCAYKVQGEGCFCPASEAHPFIGENGRMEYVEEERVEMIFPAFLQKKTIETLYQYHPYEEPAFNICQLENLSHTAGLGRVGELPKPMDAEDFLQSLKEIFNVKMIRYYGDLQKSIRKVAVCGGGGSSMIHSALASGADAYVTGDIKYHDFHTADKKMLIADIGHLESEVFIKEIIFNEVKENFATFAVTLSKVEKMQIGII